MDGTLPTSPSDTSSGPRKWCFARGITSLTVDIPSSSTSNRATAMTDRAPLTTQSRWRTKEFYFYYAVFAVVVPCMAHAVINLSRPSHPNYHHFAHRLSEGWIMGWKIDNSDHQWYIFRSNLPMLTLVMIIWIALSKAYSFFAHLLSRNSSSSDSPSPTPASEARSSSTTGASLPPRTPFIIVFAFLLLFGLHGMSLPKMLIILWINYRIAKVAGWGGLWTKSAPFLTWGFNLFALFSNEVNSGYKWANLHHGLEILDRAQWAKGLLPRWQINWNITMLRLISFNMDYYWAVTSSSSPSSATASSTRATEEEKQDLLSSKLSAPLPPLNDRARVITSHPLSTYSFGSYLAYALYPPLYLAGPILTFNSFVSQLYHPPSTISGRMILGYATRFVACLLTMELVLHSMYVVAIKDEARSGAWLGESPFELSMIGFWNLIVVWLKLLIPWRFFRLWALLDSIDAPENMIRCMANNYSTLGFWRSWHRSYNLWVIRYLYVPLGGAKRALVATLVVFTFVALWHDLSLKLLTWGWVVTIFVLPEMIGEKVLRANKYARFWWYRHVCAVGGVLNVHMMMTANLIGFAIGTEGMRYMWSRIAGSWEGIRFITLASACLFVAVQVMFEYREEEKRRGVARRC